MTALTHRTIAGYARCTEGPVLLCGLVATPDESEIRYDTDATITSRDMVRWQAEHVTDNIGTIIRRERPAELVPGVHVAPVDDAELVPRTGLHVIQVRHQART